MKSKILFLITASLLHVGLAVKAQKPFYPKPKNAGEIPFGKKLPTTYLSMRDAAIEKIYGKQNTNMPYTSFDSVLKKFIVTTPGLPGLQNISSHSYSSTVIGQPITNTNAAFGFHLTKDINTATQSSYPHNNPANAIGNFAVLNNVSYFAAYDDVYGNELWRSDGTSAGTYLVKDINPGQANSDANGIVTGNGLLYFSANSPDNGVSAWVSDGTESGTHLLKSLYTGLDYSNPNQFANANGNVFFVASVNGTNNQL